MDHVVVFAVLLCSLVLFVWGMVRHDLVALSALIILVAVGIIESDTAFSGFAHPAVITVAAVLVVGRGLQRSGLVDLLAKILERVPDRPTVQVILLCVVTSLASAVMNNVGALAFLMPAAIQLARKHSRSPSYLLMPMAFASLLGGMLTQIGTPPNMIIASLRAQSSGEPFGMFDFTPVGAGLAAAGVLFIGLTGWRFLPKRKGETADEDRYQVDDYITEVKVSSQATVKGQAVGELRETFSDVDILGIVRSSQRIHAPSSSLKLKTNDILLLQADSDHLKQFVEKTKTDLAAKKRFRKDAEGSDDISYQEAVVTSSSPLVRQTAASLKIRGRFGVNILALSRHGETLRQRLDRVRFKPGDVLLIQGRTHILDDALDSMGCLPLAERSYSVGEPKRIILALLLFAGGIILTVTGLMRVQVAFTITAVSMVLTGILPVREMYDGIDWPVIILLGAMLPVGGALESTGGASLIADQMLRAGMLIPTWASMAMLLLITMLLSGVINNAATVVLMAPIAVHIASGLGISPDASFMIIAVGASCAFLTPIGHQSNTLVMGPGGYRFSDYLRLGIPMTAMVMVLGVILIQVFWT